MEHSTPILFTVIDIDSLPLIDLCRFVPVDDCDSTYVNGFAKNDFALNPAGTSDNAHTTTLALFSNSPFTVHTVSTCSILIFRLYLTFLANTHGPFLVCGVVTLLNEYANINSVANVTGLIDNVPSIYF